MSDIIRQLEELSFRTLPALEQERYNGWVLRWSDGGSRRSNSVNAASSPDVPLAEMIEYCENWFTARRAPAIFRLTPLAPAELQSELHDRGYRHAAPTDVMTSPAIPTSADPRVQVADRPNVDWLQTISDLPADSPRLRKLAVQLTTSGGMNRFASVVDSDEVVAVGLGIDLGRHTTIYNMHTSPEARRRGLAAGVLSTLLALGQEGGSTHAVLQVTQDNDAAQALYRGFGFSPVYEYSYMEPPPAG